MECDSQKIINSANAFLLAAERAREQRPLGSGQLQMLLVPAVVCTAFAVELYFKGIIALENKNARGHELSKLFDRLSKESQTILIATLQLDRPNFEQKLKAISCLFVEWRYIFEQRSANVDFSFLEKLALESKCVAEGLAKPAVRGTPREEAAQRNRP